MRENVASKALTSLLLMGLLLAGLIAASGLIEQVGSQSAFRYVGRWTGTVTGQLVEAYEVYNPGFTSKRSMTFHYEIALTLEVEDGEVNSADFIGHAEVKIKKLDYVFTDPAIKGTSASMSPKEFESDVYGVISLDPPKIRLYFEEEMRINIVLTDYFGGDRSGSEKFHRDFSRTKWTDFREFTYTGKEDILSLSLSFSKKEPIEGATFFFTEKAGGDISRVGKVEEKEPVKEVPPLTYKEEIQRLIDLGDKQGALERAVEFAIEKLGLDPTAIVIGPVYADLWGLLGIKTKTAYAITLGKPLEEGGHYTGVLIFDPAFANAETLISTIMHEWIHCEHIRSSRSKTMTRNAAEVEAYLTELERSEETGLAKWTTINRKEWDFRKLLLKKYFDQLKPEEKEKYIERYEKAMETMPGVASTITLYINPASMPMGSQATINGTIYPPQEAPVTIEYSVDEGATWVTLTTLTSDPEGGYSYIWKPPSSGIYLIRASWLGDAHRMGATEVKSLRVEGSSSTASILKIQYMGKTEGALTVHASHAEAHLEMTIEPVKTEYRPDEPIHIFITIQNKGPTTLVFNQRMAINRETTPEEFREIAFNLIKPNGERADFTAFINIGFPDKEDFIKLEENSAIDRTMNLNAQQYDIDEPGAYTITATYSNQESGYYEWNDTAWVKVELGAWRGKLESNTIEIKIQGGGAPPWLIWAALCSAFAIAAAFLFLGRRGPSKPTPPTLVPGEEAKALDVVGGFLDQMRVRYSLDPTQNTLISRGWSVEGKIFTIVAGVSGPWVVVRAIILPKDQMPPEAEADVYKRMLEVSYSHPELRYDVDGEGNLGTTQTMPIAGLNFENFKSEFTAVLDAIKRFITDIAPKFEVEL